MPASPLESIAERIRAYAVYVLELMLAYIAPRLPEEKLRLPGAPTPAKPCELPYARSAVIVVDIQPCWWTESESVKRTFPHLEENVSALLERARADGMPVVHVRAGYEKSPHVRLLHDMHPNLNKALPPPQAEPWAEAREGEPIVFKCRFDGFQHTELLDVLNKMAVTRVYLCGLVTSACVLSTATGAFNNGIESFIVEDCTADRTIERHRTALAMYNGYTTRVCHLADVLTSGHARLSESCLSNVASTIELDMFDCSSSDASTYEYSPESSPVASRRTEPTMPTMFKLGPRQVSPSSTLDDLTPQLQAEPLAPGPRMRIRVAT